MLSIKESIKTFSIQNTNDQDVKTFCQNTLDNIIFYDSSPESSSRALVRYCALLKKQAAELKALYKDKTDIQNQLSSITKQLALINSFITFIRKNDISYDEALLAKCLKSNNAFIKLH